MSEIPTKKCTCCKEYKNLDCFYKRKRGKSKLKSTCIECDRINNIIYASLPLDQVGLSKICTKCRENKDISEFPRDKYKKDGFSTQCKNCHREYIFKKKYGISIKEYNEILKTQDDKCAICNRSQIDNNIHNLTRKPTFLPVDHCHKTGKIRGLLCGNCNVALGLFQDNPEILLKAITYLKNNGNTK